MPFVVVVVVENSGAEDVGAAVRCSRLVFDSSPELLAVNVAELR